MPIDMPLSCCQVYVDFVRVVLKDLRLVWDKGFWQLELKCDNTLLVETILVGGSIDIAVV
ncbi:hypothetical protein J1N35_020403 [Gossypium stocksii]|uniref:Uncharacterized protein n=1 Tax=Gossypium stocksii TaxID=47602 RepID=A0A9D3VDR9_9ROSI|nr:hypothetical protein J1N35_020403 [Gossypium stocksii]